MAAKKKNVKAKKTTRSKKSSFPGFPKELLHFLDDLSYHNDRDWFAKHKHRYESEVREPALAFIRAMEAPLKKVSPHFRAIPKKSGGSLMRVYRDTRFSKDKTPYKTNVGIHFRHALGKDVHAPGFYFHIEPESIFIGAGIWHPDSPTLKKIRTAIVEDPKAWKRARDAKSFASQYELHGDSLKRAPRDFDAEHPYIVDLKRKDFIGLCHVKANRITKSSILEEVASTFTAAKPLVKFLCNAIHVPF